MGSSGSDRRGRTRGLTLSAEQETAWGSALHDLDNDGDLDLAVTVGPIVGNPETEDADAAALRVRHVEDQPDGLWVQGADGWFTDEAPAWGFDRRGVGRGLLAVDLDLDGTLVHSAPDIAAALNRRMAVAGQPPFALPEVVRMIGDGAEVLLEKA